MEKLEWFVDDFIKYGTELREELISGNIESDEYNEKFQLKLDMSVADSGGTRVDFMNAMLQAIEYIAIENNKKIKTNKVMAKRNKLQEMVDVLKKNGTLTENEIHFKAFGYDRNNSDLSNKKYADMLRRGLSKGVIGRMAVPDEAISRSKFVYYATKEQPFTFDFVYQYEPFTMMKMVKRFINIK
jgi:MoaA/NifB/PqqE/SkfB family radical SAM enzyme